MKLKRYKPEQQSHVLKVLKYLVNYESPTNDELEIIRAHKKRNYNTFNIARDYAILAKKCLISHRFAAAATMLDVVCQEIYMDDVFFYKASSVVLENVPSTTNENFFYFIRHVMPLKFINKREVILEYLIYSLINKDLDGPYNTKVLTTNLPAIKIMKNSIIDPLLKAYLGMFDYLEWAQNKKESPQDVYASSHAEKALTIFKDATNVPGQWDIFILKIIEMLEFLNRTEEIEEILKNYIEINPNHINSSIYYCWFLNKYKSESSDLIPYLKSIAKSCPSDPSVLLLVNLTRIDQPKKALKYLFMFLDYPIHTNNLDAWQVLLNMVVSAFKNKNDLMYSKVISFWEERYDIWYHIHFNPKNISIKNNEMVLLIKGVLLSAFVKSHPYIQAVETSLLQVSHELSDKYSEEMTYVKKIAKQSHKYHHKKS